MYVLLQVLKLKSRGFWIVMLKWGTCLSRIGNSIGRETKDRGQVPAHCVYFLISPPWFLPMGLNLNLVIAFCLGHAPFRAQIRACWFGAQATPEQSEPCHFDTALQQSALMFKFLLNQIMNALFLSIATVMNFNNNYTQALGLDFFFCLLCCPYSSEYCKSWRKYGSIAA